MRWTCQSSGVYESLRVLTRRVLTDSSERLAGRVVFMPGRHRKTFSLRRLGVSGAANVVLEVL